MYDRASMGPPSEDDGKMFEASAKAERCHRLQWGRRPRTTESRSSAGHWRLYVLASMGPPSEDDGKQACGPSPATTS